MLHSLRKISKTMINTKGHKESLTIGFVAVPVLDPSQFPRSHLLKAPLQEDLEWNMREIGLPISLLLIILPVLGSSLNILSCRVLQRKKIPRDTRLPHYRSALQEAICYLITVRLKISKGQRMHFAIHTADPWTRGGKVGMLTPSQLSQKFQHNFWHPPN